MLRRIFCVLFGQRAQPKDPFPDSILGTLVPGESGWSVAVVKGGHSFQFTIAGKAAPDPKLLAHAHDIFNDFDSFQSSIRQCINLEAKDHPDNLKAELKNLEIDDISLVWPNRPNDGMIFFRGSDNDVGLWRCDYIDRKPTGLGCDT